MLFYVMLCNVMWCNVMWCNVMWIYEYDVLVLVNVDFVNSLLNVKWERDKVIFNEVRL